jgi:gluconate 2-dehydrogenase gamma chain
MPPIRDGRHGRLPHIALLLSLPAEIFLPPSHLVPSRRTFVKGLLGTTSFWLFSGHQGWSDALASNADGPYSPAYFTAAEWRFLQAACERIFPHDDVGPGALDLAVPEFIDRQMNTSYGRGEDWFMAGPFQDGPANLGYQLPLAPRDLYRHGIAATDSYARQQHGKAFADLAAADQVAILTALEGGAVTLGNVPGRTFFEQLRTNTMEGAFSDPIHGGNRHLGGWVMLGFPGARADFMDWVDQYGPAYPFGPVSISGETA